MSVAMIARADQGGLGTQTLEMARHLRPGKILVVDLGDRGRGRSRVDRYYGLGADVEVCHGNPKLKHLSWLCEGSTAIYTAEGTYGDRLPYVAAVAKVRLVIHANPELWTERARDATTEIVLPTSWEAHRVPGSSVMPMPVDRDRLPYRQRTEARTFWHPCAPAMEDRNGTGIVLGALHHVTKPCRVILTGTGYTGVEQIGPVRVERVGERENYWDGYEDADVMILPRRYGGLSLPVQEALSSGMPVVMLDCGPYVHTSGVVAVPTTASRDYPMKGGLFPIFDTDPTLLARVMDDLVANPGMVADLSREADEHAQSLAWSRWEKPWRALLERP